MFSLKKLRDEPFNRIIQYVILGIMMLVFLGSCGLYAFKNSIIFPIINSVLLLSTFVLFKGKYRLYALFFSMPFIIFFNYKPLGIGSFYSYSVIAYCILIVIEFLLKKDKTIVDATNIKRITLIIFLAAYSIILTMIIGQISSLIKTVSIFGYLICVSLFFLDFRSKKELSFLILLIATAFLIANVLAYFILFRIKGDIAIQFLERFVSRSYVLHYKANNASFRYPGLANDPNYLGFYTLLLTTVVVISFKKLKFKIPILIITLMLQVFPLIGESKNYLLVIVLLILIVSVMFLFKKNGVFISVGVLAASLIVLLFFGNSILLPTLLRLINIDSRDGFLNALTTGRTSIQLMYFNEYLTHPVSFLVGRGFNTLLNNASAHSVYIMSFWYFGIIGTAIFYYWISLFLPIKTTKTNKLCLLPILIMAVYALSLDYISYSEMFLFILFMCCLSINAANQSLKSLNRKDDFCEASI